MNSRLFAEMAFLAIIGGVAGALALNLVRDDRARIDIVSLEFVADPVPSIRQSRVVYGRKAVAAVWEAEINDPTTGRGTICSGRGGWEYTTGLREPLLAIDDWAGDPGCWDRLPFDVVLQACAEYLVADNDPERECSLGFVKVRRGA